MMDLITCLVEGSRGHESPWPSCHFDEDFILVSEFSELEGPRPLLTIPEDGGGSFNVNTFTVRIMSVDCTAPISFEAGFKPGNTTFKTVGDTQVVLVEPSEGAIAYVHHFTLYDIHARGFVRPFCMAYITHQGPKIMNNFTTFRDYFTRISSYFKFGNALVFLEDLKRRHEYLKYTRRKLLENDKPIGCCYQLPFDMKGFNFETIEDSLRDTEELQHVICAYLSNDMFAEQKVHVDLQLENLFLNVDDGHSNIEELDKKYEGFQPRSVGISSGRKFDTQLRSLADLSSPSKQEAFALLQKTYSLFRKTKFLTAIHERTNAIKIELELQTNNKERDSYCARVPEGLFLKSRSKCPEEAKSLNLSRSVSLSSASPRYASPRYMSPDLFHRAWDSSSCSSWPSRQNSFELIRNVGNSSSGDENPSLKDPENWSLISTEHSINSRSESHSDASRMMEPFPGTAKRLEPISLENRPPAVINRPISRGSDDVDSTGSPSIKVAVDGPKVAGTRENSDSGSESTRLYRPNSVASFSSIKSNSSSADSRQTANSSAKEGGQVSDIFDPPSESSNTLSLLSLRNKYSFFCHLVYSLMIGRPVVISANESHRKKVHSIIVSLLPCIPGLPVNRNSVIFWTTGPLHILNLATVKLVGLAKIRGKDPVPKSVLQYVTVLDYESATLSAPPYEGSYLTSVFDRQRIWPCASVFLESFRSAQIELSSQAFIMFTLIFAEAGNRQKAESKQSKHPAMKINPHRFLQFRFPPQDIKIIENLVEVIKDNLQNSFHRAMVGEEEGGEDKQHGAFSCMSHSSRQPYCETPCIKLNFMRCQNFCNVVGKKK